MKIGIVSPGGFDPSGRERVIPVFLALVERLARRHDVHVYTLYGPAGEAAYALRGATVHHLGRVQRGPNRAVSRTVRAGVAALMRDHGEERFDLIHGLWASESGLIAALAARLLRIPSVVTVAGGELVALPEIGYGGHLYPRTRWMIGTVLRMATGVTCASRYVLDSLSRHRPDARLLPLGADSEVFSARLFAPDGPPWRLIHVASLNRVKDQPTLLRAFRRILEDEPDALLDVVGEDTLSGEIQRQASGLDVQGSVAFHGFVPSERIGEMLRRSHLLLHTSRFESGPMVFLEAALSGIPTVGTSVGLIDDLAGEAALAVPVGDDTTLAAAALFLLHDPECRAEVARRARAWALAHDADWTAAQLDSLYVELVERRTAVMRVSTAR